MKKARKLFIKSLFQLKGATQSNQPRW